MAFGRQQRRRRRDGRSELESMQREVKLFRTDVNHHRYRLSHHLNSPVEPSRRLDPLIQTAATATLGKRDCDPLAIDIVSLSNQPQQNEQQQVINAAVVADLQHNSPLKTSVLLNGQRQRTGNTAGNESSEVRLLSGPQRRNRFRLDKQSVPDSNSCNEEPKRTKRSNYNAMKRFNRLGAIMKRSSYLLACTWIALIVIASVPTSQSSSVFESHPIELHQTDVQRLSSSSAARNSLDSLAANIDQETLLLKSIDVQRTHRKPSQETPTATGNSSNNSNYLNASSEHQFFAPRLSSIGAKPLLLVPLQVVDQLDKSGSSNIDRRTAALQIDRRQVAPTESSSPKFVLTNELDQYLDDMNHNELRTVASGKPISDLFHSRPLLAEQQQSAAAEGQHKQQSTGDSDASSNGKSRTVGDDDKLGASARRSPLQQSSAESPPATGGERAPASLDESQSERQIYSECALILQRTYVKNIGDPK